MARVTDHIEDATADWINKQHMFFVGTAPANGGHVNLSPKGLDSIRILDANRVAYVDLTGSGAETIAHIRDDGRITFMFCAFDGAPRILRLYGTGAVHLPESSEFETLAPMFPHERGVRSIITASIDRVQDSCGYGVPIMEFRENRERLNEWIDRRSDEDIHTYWANKNRVSIDDLPALDGD